MKSDTDFYLTLLSNSSTNYFPENLSTRFCTQLQRSVKLSEEWCVALVELQYPCTLLSVNNQGNVIYVVFKTSNGSIEKSIRIEAGNYDTIDDLLLQINSNVYIIDKVSFSINLSTKRVSVDFRSDEIKSLKLCNTLSLQLGFEPGTDLFIMRHGSHPANILHGIAPQLFIYCDIIEPQVVGDTIAQLLRIVTVDKSKYLYGTHKMLPQPHYVPVLKREFETLEIDIRSDSGEPVPFEFGTVCVTLHFKKSSPLN